MTHQDEAARVDAEIRSQTAALRAFSGTDSYRHLAALLGALRLSYMHDLVDVTPESLQIKQGALQQVIALERALVGEMDDSPRV